MAVNRIRKYIDAYQPTLLDTEWAYIAGILDGEGTLSIIRVNKKRRNLHWYILQPVISVTNTNMKLMAWLGEKLNMKINGRHRTIPPSHNGKKRNRGDISECFVFSHFGYKNYNLLKQIQPYMIIKKQQCDLMIQYIENRIILADDQYNSPYTEEDERLWLAVRKLNRKPSAAYPDVVGLTLKSMISQPNQEISLLTES